MRAAGSLTVAALSLGQYEEELERAYLEVLYDIDVEAQAFAREHGMELRRTPSLNDRPEFIAALAAIVEEAVR